VHPEQDPPQSPEPPRGSLAELAREVARRHAEQDAGIERLVRATGLACPEGCGACCLSPEVETSVADVLPLAFALFARGAAEEALARARAARDAGPCVLYAASPGDPRRGRCTVYAERPSICRLFGFASRRARGGGQEHAACRELRAAHPEASARAAAAVSGGLEAPRIDAEPGAIALLAGDARPLPINHALRLALERVGLQRSLAGAGTVPEQSSTDP
jgi:Fe-S-cluster containining protein